MTTVALKLECNNLFIHLFIYVVSVRMRFENSFVRDRKKIITAIARKISRNLISLSKRIRNKLSSGGTEHD